MRKPENYSPERWDQLPDDHKVIFWEAWANALDSILSLLPGDALAGVTANIAAARQAANEYRARSQRE